jgi:hypothetical protein
LIEELRTLTYISRRASSVAIFAEDEKAQKFRRRFALIREASLWDIVKDYKENMAL